MISELRLAIRNLLRSPGFAVSAIAILGLGCAATTAIFSIAYGILLRDLPYPQPDRLVSMGAQLPKMGFPKANAGAADYFDWRKQQQVFDDIALTRAVGNFNLVGSGEPERLLGARTTASLFSTLRVTPLIGRTFTEEEQLDPERAARVAVLSYRLWRRRFNGDPAILGRTIRLNGRDTEVLGVMRPDFQYPTREFELWAPLYYPPTELKNRSDFSYIGVGRLRPGVTVEQARAHMRVIAANLAREYPVTNTDVGAYVEPMLGQITEAVRPAIWLLLAAVGTLYLVGCVNLTDLLLARATGRQREFAIRRALGATPMQLLRQSFMETIPIALAEAALGVVGASWLLALLIPLLPSSMPRLEEIAIQGPVLLFTTLLSIASAFVISLAPALKVSVNLERGPSGRARFRDTLIVAEIACTVVLLTSAGLLIRSFVKVSGTSAGFEPDRVLALHFAVDRPMHGPEDRGVAQYLGRLIERVRSVPGVELVSIVNRLPLGGQTQTLGVDFEGRSGSINVDSRSIGANYFRALGIPLIAGRDFRDDDSDGRAPVGIIDERIAREVFGRENPVGKRFHVTTVPPMPWIQVVGVAGHIRHEGLDRDPRPQVYWPYRQRTQDRQAMVVKTTGDPAAMTPAVRAAIQEVDPNQPLYDVRSMSQVVERSLIGQRVNAVLVGSLAGLALLLASIGLYSVVSQLTARRSREFGIRLALGANPGSLLRMVLRQGLTRAVCGLVAGLTLSAAVTQLLGKMLHGVGTLDLTTYIFVTGLLLLVVLAASYSPARRAANTDPINALRSE
jgi:putative ABC transport system permease protein